MFNKQRSAKVTKDAAAQTEPEEQQAPAQGAATEPLSADQTVTMLRTEYEALKAQIGEARQSLERAARIQADFENARRRLEREKTEFIKYAHHEIIAEVIPVVDDFQRAFAAADSSRNFDVLYKGVEMILKQLQEMLARKGVAPIEAVGKLFDPHCHEALMQEESAAHPENTVLAEFQIGYRLNDCVLRPAKVKVSRRPAAESGAAETLPITEPGATGTDAEGIGGNDNQQEQVTS